MKLIEMSWHDNWMFSETRSFGCLVAWRQTGWSWPHASKATSCSWATRALHRQSRKAKLRRLQELCKSCARLVHLHSESRRFVRILHKIQKIVKMSFKSCCLGTERRPWSSKLFSPRWDSSLAQIRAVSSLGERTSANSILAFRS